MTRKSERSQEGSILVMAVVLSFVTIMLGVTFLTFAITLHNHVDGQIRLSQSLLTAQSAAAQGMFDKATGKNLRNGPWEFYADNIGQYEIIPAGQEEIGYGTSSTDRIVATGTSNYRGGTSSSKSVALFSYESYADYLYISHRERDSLRHVIISFWTPDTLDGKVHSNDTIHVSIGQDEPVFMKRTTTTANYFYPQSNHAHFLDGTNSYHWGQKIVFPDQATEIRRNSGYNWGSIGSDSLTQIVLSGPFLKVRKCGLFRINTVDSIRCYPATIAEAPSYDIPSTGCVFVNGKVWISASRGRTDIMDGEIPERSKTDGGFQSEGFEGKLTIASADTMIITDNLVYKHSRNYPPNRVFSVPPSMDSCSDVLGLISERYIMIHRLVRDTVYINAAMAAVTGSISVQDIYWQIAPGWNNRKQSLVIYGSLAQRNRGIVHSTDYPQNHERGFVEKDYHYDIRLKENPPPHYLPTRNISFIYLTGDDGGY